MSGAKRPRSASPEPQPNKVLKTGETIQTEDEFVVEVHRQFALQSAKSFISLSGEDMVITQEKIPAVLIPNGTHVTVVERDKETKEEPEPELDELE